MGKIFDLIIGIVSNFALYIFGYCPELFRYYFSCVKIVGLFKGILSSSNIFYNFVLFVIYLLLDVLLLLVISLYSLIFFMSLVLFSIWDLINGILLLYSGSVISSYIVYEHFYSVIFAVLRLCCWRSKDQ